MSSSSHAKLKTTADEKITKTRGSHVRASRAACVQPGLWLDALPWSSGRSPLQGFEGSPPWPEPSFRKSHRQRAKADSPLANLGPALNNETSPLSASGKPRAHLKPQVPPGQAGPRPSGDSALSGVGRRRRSHAGPWAPEAKRMKVPQHQGCCQQGHSRGGASKGQSELHSQRQPSGRAAGHEEKPRCAPSPELARDAHAGPTLRAVSTALSPQSAVGPGALGHPHGAGSPHSAKKPFVKMNYEKQSTLGSLLLEKIGRGRPALGRPHAAEGPLSPARRACRRVGDPPSPEVS